MKYQNIILFFFSFCVIFQNIPVYATYVNQSEIISSGGGESAGGAVSSFSVLGEPLVNHSSDSAEPVGFISAIYTGNSIPSLADVIAILQAICGMNAPIRNISYIQGDKFGLKTAVYILQKITNIRQIWYKDADGDKYSDGTAQQSATRPDSYYMTSELTAIFGDCDDSKPSVYPGAVEIQCDSIDQDCNGSDQCTTDNGLIAFYPFNSNADDESGNGNHAAVFGATLIQDRFGNPNTAYSFDGTDDYISIGNFDTPGQITITSWIKTAAVFNGDIFSKHKNVLGEKGFIFFIYYDERYSGTVMPEFPALSAAMSADGSNWVQAWSTVRINDGVWHFVATTYDGNNVRVYVDGIAGDLKPLTGSLTNISWETNIGVRITATNKSSYFNGIIDDIRVYNRALSENEVLALYHID